MIVKGGLNPCAEIPMDDFDMWIPPAKLNALLKVYRANTFGGLSEEQIILALKEKFPENFV